jgi:hypothetical protein
MARRRARRGVTSDRMANKRMLVVICAMGLAAASATCVGKLTPSTQRSQAQGSETQGTLVHGTATNERATGLRLPSVHVVGGQLVGER